MRVVGAVVLAVAGAVLVGCTAQPDASSGPSSSTVSSTATTTTTSSSSSSVVVPTTTVAVASTVTQTVVETVVVDPRPTLTHTGFGGISLGMTEADLVATGLVGERAVGGDVCAGYHFKSGNGAVWVQQGRGVAAIQVKSRAVTAEGLPVDLAPSDPRVAETYPSGEPGPNGYSVWVEDDVFYFISGGTTLAVRGQGCFN